MQLPQRTTAQPRGAFKAIRRTYVPRYLAEFRWRFNCRARLRGMLIDELLAAAIMAKPKPYKLLRLADVDG